jgi:hypothetical protein
MVIHAGIEASFAIASHGMGGQGNEAKIMESSVGANQPGRGQSIQHRHLDVHQNQIECLRQNSIDALSAIDRNGYPNTKIAKQFARKVPIDVVVLANGAAR